MKPKITIDEERWIIYPPSGVDAVTLIKSDLHRLRPGELLNVCN